VENSQISAQGGGAISGTTQWNWIDTGGDANDFDGDETITVSGTDHDGNAVSDTYSLVGKSDETLDVFLAWVENLYGDSDTVDASFDSSGRLVIEDLQSGSSQMTATVTPNNTALQFNTAGAFGNDISNGDTISISGTRGDGTTVSTITYTITDKSTDTLQDLLNTISAGGAGDDGFGETSRTATLSISDGKVTITDDTAGDSRLALTLITNNEGSGTLNFGDVSVTTEGREMQLVAGEDARVTVDGAVITKDSNTITDIIEGVTLNLVGASDDTTVTLKVERDIASIKSTIQGMANSYNSVMGYINTQFSYDEDEEEVGGVLFGDGTLRSVKSELINTVTETVTGLSSDYNRLALIGITLDDSVNMTIDDDDLTEALETNFNYVKKLFTAYGSASSSLFQYVGHTDETEGGSYAVDITTAATQTTVTGGTSLSGTIGAGVTLTITDFATGRMAQDVDVAGMDIDGVVNALNSEFASETTEQIRGDTDTGYASSTLWSAVSGAEDGDLITFSGMKRSGVLVSGSYTVDTTATVGELLDGIENVFDDEVTAELDDNNRLVITDKQVGDSQISFNIDTSAVSGLDFGTLSTVTEGRYTMDITASKTVDDKLLLTHNAYGTGHIITTESDGGDPLGLNGTAATKEWGVDVAGTINGEAATGSGRRLTLSSTSSNNAAGLSVLYTGTGTTSTTFTMTLGIGELLDRQLGFITDSSDGYVTFKQTSLGDRIDDYEDRIEDMEAFLARKMENMIDQFVAMELALSRISNQSEWLSGQIEAAYSGWS
jgi:flagellar hook-associated protein 2